jgi:glycosyltransferase involved in cell wall biosynthesis
MVTISRLEKPKNIQSVLLAVARAVKKDPRLSKELRFKIGGKGSYLEELKKLSSSLGINHLVEFCGFISDDQIPAFFMQGSFTIFVPIDEPMGLIPIESGLFGRATLGANQGGVPELIKDNQTGILVDPQNIDAIADQIVKLCNDRELAVRLGENARKDVLKNFNFDDFVEDFERRAMS